MSSTFLRRKSPSGTNPRITGASPQSDRENLPRHDKAGRTLYAASGQPLAAAAASKRASSTNRFGTLFFSSVRRLAPLRATVKSSVPASLRIPSLRIPSKVPPPSSSEEERRTHLSRRSRTPPLAALGPPGTATANLTPSPARENFRSYGRISLSPSQRACGTATASPSFSNRLKVAAANSFICAANARRVFSARASPSPSSSSALVVLGPPFLAKSAA
mmetsp:Transcript_7275/g.31003  ORF Transcript_7275/g.31003 Transcript_7275/m.31003 type:complete len:219 (+) Transcript_7275:1348-2004(+)